MARKKLVVFDLELTCWEPKKPELIPEIIEIGAVKLDLVDRKIIDYFSTLVKPKSNPELSEYCTKLTGINQSDFFGVGQFPESYSHFIGWMGSHHNNVLCSWGRDWEALTRDCQAHGIAIRHKNETLNAKTLFSLKYNRSGLDTALESLGLKFEGKRHRALDDAKATAEVLLKIL